MIDIFIAGAQKAGITSLLRYLSQSPDILSHPQMEMGFFGMKNEYAKGDQFLEKKYGLKTNHDQKIMAKQANMAHNKTAIKKLCDHNHNCKIIFLTRDPIQRVFSSYVMMKKGGEHLEDFNEVIKNGLTNARHWHSKYVTKLGCYEELLQNLREYFPKDQIKVIQFEDLISKPNSILKIISHWVDVNNFPVKFEKHNTRSTPSLNPLQRKLGGGIVAQKSYGITPRV